MTKEDEIKKIEEEIAELEGSMSEDELSEAYGSPQPEQKDSTFRFFRDILSFPDSWKVSNLKDEEIGKSRLTVRSYLELSQYADAEDLEIISKYFNRRADIVAATAMGRKGFLAQLFVTQIKKEQKLKEPEKKKKGLFSSKEKEEENE